MSSAAPFNRERKAGSATAEGTLRYAARFQGRAAAGHFREIRGGLVLSSIGIGTYLGDADDATDGAYVDAIVAAVQGGINVVDSAINYRFQRSERAVGSALRELFDKGYGRDEIMVCTKAGFLTPDGEMPADPNIYFAQEFLERGIFRVEDIAAGCHCMAPDYLADQLERSRQNLGLDTIDVFYLHNPETQLSEVPAEEFRRRIREAFLFLESAVATKKIRAYGMATWNSFREDPKAEGFLSLQEMVKIAKDVAGDDHHFRFVQLPFNLAMPEALTRPNQPVGSRSMPMVQAARDAGIALVTSAALLQGQLTKNLAVIHQFGAGIEGQRHAGAAIRAIGAGINHRAGRHEPSAARESKSGTGGHRARFARTIPEVVRIEKLRFCGNCRRARMAFVEPRINRAADFFQLSGEEVIRAVNDDEALGSRHRGEECFHIRPRAELIVAALNDQFWFRAIAQVRQIGVVHRNSQSDQVRDALVRAARAQSHQRTEAKAREKNRPPRKFRRKIIERGTHVACFARAAIMLSFALARAAEIEAQHGNVTKMQRFGRLIHNFVVHRAAEKRMRMADHADQRRISDRHGPEQRLQAPGGARDKEIAMKGFRHEIASARV